MSDPLVEVNTGAVKGRPGDAVATFLGIPFAEPPVGALRFQPPQPPAPWRGAYDATRHGPAAMQTATVLETARGFSGMSSEDCLYLNIWAPTAAVRESPSLPVIVWLHGGSFLTGSGAIPWYDGAALATRGDIVVVTINYRLGPFGYLNLSALGGDDYASSGNVGLLDQIAAIRWVRDNIAAFGGDPERICVVGESAGSMSVGTLLTARPAQGLVARAIMQSGTPVGSTNAQSQTISEELFDVLNLAWDDGGFDQLLHLDPNAILRAADEVTQRRYAQAAAGDEPTFSWGPTIDGIVLDRDPWEATEAGAGADVAVVIGTTADEMRITRILAPDAPVDDESCAEMSNRIFWQPTCRYLEARLQAGAPTWSYSFEWRSPADGGRYGSAHTFEIPFIFDNFTATGVEEVLGPTTPGMRALAKTMQDAWVRFAAEGDPATPALADWKPNAADPSTTMLFDTESRPGPDPRLSR